MKLKLKVVKYRLKLNLKYFLCLISHFYYFLQYCLQNKCFIWPNICLYNKQGQISSLRLWMFTHTFLYTLDDSFVSDCSMPSHLWACTHTNTHSLSHTHTHIYATSKLCKRPSSFHTATLFSLIHHPLMLSPIFR